MQIIPSYTAVLWGPVVKGRLTRPQADSFIAALNRRTGMNWRLPTRAEASGRSGSGLILMTADVTSDGFAYAYYTTSGTYSIARGRGTDHLPVDVQLIRNVRRA